jgi:uncharacterized membrane protein YvbJ
MDNNILKCNKCGSDNKMDYIYCKNCGIELHSKITTKEAVLVDKPSTTDKIIGISLMVVGVIAFLLCFCYSFYVFNDLFAGLMYGAIFGFLTIIGYFITKKKSIEYIDKEVDASEVISNEQYEEDIVKKENLAKETEMRNGKIILLFFIGAIVCVVVSILFMTLACNSMKLF